MSATTQAAPVLPMVQIRPFEKKDLHEVRMLLGMSSMEGLAEANRRTYIHPIPLSIWLVLSTLLVQLLNWWPRPEFGPLGYIKPVPAYAMIAVPLLFAVDWVHRAAFEKNLHTKLSLEDILSIPSFYTRSPASGFFVLAKGNTPIGCIAIDAASPDEKLADVDVLKETKQKQSTKKYPTSDHALMRHFHVDGPYRRTGVSSDLVSHALSHAFASTTVQKVYASTSPLTLFSNSVWKDAGFTRVQDGWKAKRGIESDGTTWFTGKGSWVELSRTTWEAKKEE